MQVIINTAPAHLTHVAGAQAALTLFVRELSGLQTKVHLPVGVSLVDDDAWLAVQGQAVLQERLDAGTIVDMDLSVSSPERALLEAKGPAANRMVQECYDAKLAASWLAHERVSAEPRHKLIEMLEARHAELTKPHRGAA